MSANSTPVDKKPAIDQIDDRVYRSGFTLGAKLSIVSIVMLFLGFFINFPLKEIITARITQALAQNRACPISFQNLEFEWFLPKVKIRSLEMPSLCFGGALPNGKTLVLKNLSANILGPSFSPLGLKLSHNFTLEGNTFQLNHALTPSGHVFRMDPMTLKLDDLAGILGNQALSGTLKFNGYFDVDSSFNPKDIKFSLLSDDLNVKSINLGGFTIPSLKIGFLQLRVNMNARQKVLIDELSLGNDSSPIKSNLTGSVDLNKISPETSVYNLSGTLGFSDTFRATGEFGFVNLFLKLDQQKTYEGSYKININGALGAPPRISFD